MLEALSRVGAFSMAIEDVLQGQQFGAIDRFGIDTLVWSRDDEGLRFAKRADALAGHEPALDVQALLNYLYFHCIPAPRTIYAEVSRLPAGHCVWLEAGQARLHRYWNPTFETERPTGREPSFDDLKAEFRRLLRTAVERQLESGVPACFLSGGTDSSTIAGVIREVTGRGAEAFSIGFAAEGYDEMAYARIAASHFGCTHHEYYVTPDDLVDGIPKVASALDQPFGNSSILPAYYCAVRARQAGTARLLAGDGGDELFGGNARYAKQRLFSWYRAIPGALRKHAIEPLLNLSSIDRMPILRKAKSYVEQARTPMPDRLQMYNLLMRQGVDSVLTPEFAARVNLDEPMLTQRAVWNATQNAGELNTTLAFDWRYTLSESDLPKVREATRLAGVGVGFPLLDDELVTFSLRLPENYKLNGLQLRWFFKEALRDFLPEAIINKPKHGFGLPFGPWLLVHDRLRELARHSVAGLVSRGLVRSEFVSNLWDRQLPRHPGYYGEMVWILTMLEQWIQSHAPNWRL
jgi:asparagine synthase (glutamine-hydrolysing)